MKSLIRRASRQDVIRVAARSGYAISGLLHLLIGYIVVRVATGHGGSADPSGAMAAVASSRGGVTALWILVLALTPLAFWRLIEVFIGLHPAEGHPPAGNDGSRLNRMKAFGLLLVYCGIGYTAIRFALGDHETSGQQNSGLSARLMQDPWGRALLVVAGLVVVFIGGYYAYKGASRRFHDDLTSRPGRLVDALGLCGYVAEGLVLALAGILVIVATVNLEPRRAAGLDAAVQALAETSWGTVLLFFAAAGFVAYGAYSFALTRYSRM